MCRIACLSLSVLAGLSLGPIPAADALAATPPDASAGLAVTPLEASAHSLAVPSEPAASGARFRRAVSSDTVTHARPDTAPRPGTSRDADEAPSSRVDPAEETVPGPRLLTDVMVVAGATAVHSLAYPKVRDRIRHRGSWGFIWDNLRSPVRRAIEGGRADVDPFVTNYVVHPLSWGVMGLYLKERGYSNRSALAFTQLHSFAWEYVIEGSYQKPSSKDLVTNAVSSAVAIYWLHDLSERAARTGDKRLHHHVAAILNPLRPIRGMLSPGEGEGGARVEPVAGPGGYGIRVAITW